MSTPLSSAEYRALKIRAELSRASKLATMRRIAAECGLGEHWLAHNAMVARDTGRPWRGVDYSGVRRVMRLHAEMFAAHRLVDELVSRRGLDYRSLES
jgi:hypothetical protein